jgi:hypothetical protein
MTFKEKVQSMSGKEIVQAMIDGLNKEWVKVDMCSYGKYNDLSNTCFGCAATNTICQIMDKQIDKKYISFRSERALDIGTDQDFLESFEQAINSLRLGNVHEYNMYANCIKMATLPTSNVHLSALENDTYQIDLKEYQRFADSL